MSKVQRQAKTQTEGLGIKMRKVLIIFIGLILGCNLANAKSVSCWEEYDTSWKSEPTSKMASVLGNDVTIKRVGSGYIFHFMDINSNSSSVKAHTMNPILDTYNTTNPAGLGTFSPMRAQTGNYFEDYTFNFENKTYALSNSYAVWFIAIGRDIFHTYCIVDEGSSGGGGGGATGSVNFIIKATS